MVVRVLCHGHPFVEGQLPGKFAALALQGSGLFITNHARRLHRRAVGDSSSVGIQTCRRQPQQADKQAVPLRSRPGDTVTVSPDGTIKCGKVSRPVFS